MPRRDSTHWKRYSKVCDGCGSPFETFVPIARFCSKWCFYAWLSHTRRGEGNPNFRSLLPTCKVCGSLLPRQKRTRAIYCSFKCMGQDRAGDKNPAWKGGSNARNTAGFRYRAWRLAVFERDNWTCRSCGYYAMPQPVPTARLFVVFRLHAHHIDSWTDHPEKRFAVDNGLTLCTKCHRKHHGSIPQFANNGI